MKKKTVILAESFLTLTLLSNMSFAQTSVDFGKNEYMFSCASCHGVSAKGDGPVRTNLVKAPADLTVMAKRNGGVFPTQYAWEVIDGRNSMMTGAHGVRDMPVWGHIYRLEDTQPADLNARTRISSLLDYLTQIQVK